jgi:hypothetical protein
MKIPSLLIIFCLIFTTSCQDREPAKDHSTLYAVAELPAPVLNTPDFSFVFGNKEGATLHLDDFGLIREVEFIALPKTVFEIEETIKKGGNIIYKVTTADYPYPAQKGYFIDSRFVKTIEYKPPNRLKRLPKKKAIINKLLSSEGVNYIWGGNYKAGVPQMLSFYAPTKTLNADLKDRWMLKGVDCSGLLYEATNGFTPRNTSSLITFGESVKIANLSANQIMQEVEPLDIIVWKGHDIIILDKDRVIESRLDYDKEEEGNQGGVRIRKLKEVLTETLKARIPVDNYGDEVEEDKKKFVIRRWYSIMQNKQD